MLVKFVTTGGVPYAEIEILGPFGFMNHFFWCVGNTFRDYHLSMLHLVLRWPVFCTYLPLYGERCPYTADSL